ncbi:nuclear transport factor 2 family protein [Pedobacter sp. MC2016-15]|uniref:nuclear transport factor 2 family protein n=1 Tax=Pedobacter sp. MC2016-15 TaxID=2994473 RepID=UPI002245FB73|nr:nuclear transport factor 2 family protein [Pedobacter sp. MC2016-15]MCX2480108.1 nuclear transport factor 2 family protein [Pedobacter sp. MC2016-15]
MDQQEKEAIEIIRQSRYNSNTAIREHNVAGVSKYWMDDMVVISGEGGQYIGKKALVAVFTDMFAADPPVFERIPSEIIIGDSSILAWETGSWNYKTEPFRGNYSAMWRKVNGIWLMQSELFVSLD